MTETLSDESGDFSPVMDEAVASIENVQTQEEHDTQLDTEQLENPLLDSTVTVFDTDETDNSMLFGNVSYNEFSNEESVISTNYDVSNIRSSITEIPSQLTELKPLKSQTVSKPEITELQPVPVPGDANTAAAPTKVESVLLSQIQQILDQGKDTGVIVIRGNGITQSNGLQQTNSLQNLSNPVLADSETDDIQAKYVGIPTMAVDEQTVVTHKSSKLAGAHQEVTEQFLNAKIDQSKGSSTEGSEQNNHGQNGSEQQNKAEIQQTVASQSPSLADAKPVDSIFGQQLGQVTASTDPLTSVEGKFAPGTHLPVPEKELVTNLIQRFNVNPRLETSKLTMQLNPAELGSLKIDILVEGDSIKANIVAQSQQALDILDKSMPRLRTVLEEQGFKVDAFEISMNSDGGQQKDFFQEQFNSKQQEFASNGSSVNKNESFETLLDSQEDSEEADEDKSGVNLTV
jgi:flagellar hook-length control protein FliK